MRIIYCLLIAITLFSCNNNNDNVQKYTPDFSVKTGMINMIITNNETVNWLDVQITVNMDYKYKIAFLKPKQPTTIPLNEFTLKSGERFNKMTHKINTICVTVNEGVNCLTATN